MLKNDFIQIDYSRHLEYNRTYGADQTFFESEVLIQDKKENNIYFVHHLVNTIIAEPFPTEIIDIKVSIDGDIDIRYAWIERIAKKVDRHFHEFAQSYNSKGFPILLGISHQIEGEV